MTKRLTAWALVASVLVATTPWDLVVGSPKALAGPACGACTPPTPSGDSNSDSAPGGDSCPDEGECLCCPWSAHVLPVQDPAPALARPLPMVEPVFGAPQPAGRDYVNRIFHPPRSL